MSDVAVAEMGAGEAEWREGPPAPPRSNYTADQQRHPFCIANSKNEIIGTHASVSVGEFGEPCPLPISGDVRVCVASKEGEELFHLWMHDSMLAHGRERLVRRKWMLDGLKDGKHKRLDAGFCVVLDFLRVAPPGIHPDARPALGAQL